MKTVNIVSSLLVVFLLVGCGGTSSNRTFMPQQISDPIFSLLPSSFEQQTEIVNNCDGASPSYVVTYNTVETQNATFEVVAEAGGLITGTPIPPSLEIQLEARLSAALSKEYGVNVERGHELPLIIPNGKKVQHVITWKVTRVKGLFDVLYENGTAQVAFNKIADVELYERQSEELSCDGSNVIALTQPPTSNAENAVSSPVPLATTPPPTKSISYNSSDIATELNSIFGSENWFCFPDRGDAVGIKKLASEVLIQDPMVKVDTYLGTYTSGRTPYGIGATVWLNTWVPQEECPARQETAIAEWRDADLADNSSFNESRIDTLFGAGNWQCVPEFAYAVKITNLPAGTPVQYPFTALDNDSGRYGVGETTPNSGPATVWLANSISQNDCP